MTLATGEPFASHAVLCVHDVKDPFVEWNPAMTLQGTDPSVYAQTRECVPLRVCGRRTEEIEQKDTIEV